MILLGQILIGLGQVLEVIFTSLFWLVIARAVLSWVNPDPFNPIVRFISSATDPFLIPIKRFVPPIGGALDLSPIILILLLEFLRITIAGSLVEYGHEMKRHTANYTQSSVA